MASVIRIKRSSGILAPSSLKTAEMAYAYGTGTQSNQGDRLFIGTGDDGSGNATTITTIGGSYFTDMLDHVQGTLTASSAIVVDADKKIDQLLSGDIVIDGATNTITTPGKILYSNVYNDLADLPSASTYHGMFAHVHATGKGYFAHAGNWVPLANNDDLDSVTSVLRSDLDSATTELRSDLDSAVASISQTFSFTGDAGSDTVTLADSSLRFQGIPGQMLAVVTDNRVQLGLQATNVTPGNYGSATKIPTIEVDYYGRIDSIGEASIELTGGLGMDVTTTSSGTTIAQTASPLGAGALAITPDVQNRYTIDEAGRIQSYDTVPIVLEWGLLDSANTPLSGTPLKPPEEFTLGESLNFYNLGVFGGFGVTSKLKKTASGTWASPGQKYWEISIDSAQLTGAVSGIAGGSWSADSNAIVLSTTDSNEFKIIIDDNISSPLDATDSTHLVNKRQFDSGLASVQLDSASWDWQNNTLNITLGGDKTSVPIIWFGAETNFYDSVTFNDDIRLANNKYFRIGNQGQGFIYRETVDNGLYIANNSGTYVSGTNVQLISSANDPFKTISIQGDVKPVYTNTTTYDIGADAAWTWQNAYFAGNVTSRLDATDSVHVVNKRQLDSGLASVQLDSATWDETTNTLNITLGGDLTPVTINEFDDSVVIYNDKNLVFGNGYLFNNNPQTGRTTLRHDTTDHYFMMHADSSITELEIAGRGVTLIGYDVNNAMYSGMGASTGNGVITLDGNVVPGVGRGMGMYNAGFRRNLGSTFLRFGTVYVDSVDRGHYVDSGTYGNAAAVPVFTVNKTGLIDSIGTVPVAGVDSASWDSDTNTLNITTSDGTIHDVEIDYFGDSVTFDNTVRVNDLKSFILGNTSGKTLTMFMNPFGSGTPGAGGTIINTFSNFELDNYDTGYNINFKTTAAGDSASAPHDRSMRFSIGADKLEAYTHILPDTDSAHNLGSSTKRWNSLYVKEIDRVSTTDSGVYGSQTAIPVLTINSSGFIDSAGTVPLATTLNINADAGTGDVALLDSSIEVSGGFNVNTRVVDNVVTVNLDSDVLGLTSLTIDNIKIDGNTISSTDSSNQLFIDPFPVGDSGDLVIRGNLIVQGTETVVNSSIVSLNDKNLVLADSAANSSIADGAGITVGGAQYSGTKPQFIFDAATDRWDPNLPIDIPFVSLDSAVFLNGVALREVMEDHLDNFFGVDSNNAITITYDDVANTMTWKGTDASTTQKGVSSFDSSNFTITAGHVAVTVLDGGTW